MKTLTQDVIDDTLVKASRRGLRIVKDEGYYHIYGEDSDLFATPADGNDTEAYDRAFDELVSLVSDDLSDSEASAPYIIKETALRRGTVYEFATQDGYRTAEVDCSSRGDYRIYFNGKFIHVSKTFKSLERRLKVLVDTWNLEQVDAENWGDLE